MHTVSSQLTYTPTLSSLNLQLVRNQLQVIISEVTEALSSVKILDSKRSNKQQNRIENNKNDVDKKLRQALIDIFVNEEKYIVDKVLMPILSEINNSNRQLNSSFYENRCGFTEEELLNAEFYDRSMMPSIRQQKNVLFNTGLFNNKINSSFLYTNKRGFKTRRTQPQTREAEDEASLLSRLINTKRQRDGIGSRNPILPFKINDIYDNKVGPLMGDKQLKSTGNDANDKLKIAFAEGYLAHEVSQKNKPRENLFWQKFVRFGIWFAILLYVLSYFVTFKPSDSTNNHQSGIKFRVPLPGNSISEVRPEDVNVRFNDVRGVTEAKEELKDIVDYLKDPVKFTRLGARLPKGVLLVGSPGVGKTLLAKAVAGEAGVPFFQATGSEFDEMFVGTGARKMRQLFQAARQRAPCVIFIDEIDSVGAKRTNSPMHPYANQTINQMLAEMDGFERNEGIIVLAATNRPEHLDKALTRPGRFDVQVAVDPPDYKGRVDILELYLNKIIQGSDIDISKIARKTVGFTGAELENLVNQAALKAALDNEDEVHMHHIEWGFEKITMGPAKLSKIPDEETNRVTAYHEAGHTIVAYYTKDAMPLSKVTIIPRGRALGYTSMTPTEKDQYGRSKSQLLAQIDVSLGGRIAEEMIFGNDNVTTGATSDFNNATTVAENMVKYYGMSDKAGVRYANNQKNLSQQSQELVDQEIRRILQESNDRAKNLLKTHANELKNLAEALLEYETLDKDEIKTIIEGNKLSQRTPKSDLNNSKQPKNPSPSKNVGKIAV